MLKAVGSTFDPSVQTESYSCSFTKMSSAKHLLLVFTTYYLSLKCAHLTEIQTIMKDVVKETLCSTAMSGNAIGALHSCLKESLKPANRIEAECIETLYPSISDYYTQVCNESVRVEVNSDIFKCMKDVCKAKGFDPMVDYYYCLALSHKADSDCGLLALSVPENVKYRAMVAQNVTDEHKKVERIFCRKMLNDEISDELERLKTLECIILPRKDLIRKCALLFKEKHSRVLDPEILLNIGCDRSRYSDDERWVRNSFVRRKINETFCR